MKPLSIAIQISGLPITGEDPVHLSLGGSETAAVSMARALARLGHEVVLACNRQEVAERDGVRYLPAPLLVPDLAGRNCDVFVCSRAYASLTEPVAAHLVGVWHHDLPAESLVEDLMPGLAKISFSLFVSDFQQRQFAQVFPGMDAFAMRTTNGVDFDAVERIVRSRPARKPRDGATPRFLYASRPERGLAYLLLEVWPRLRQRYPRAELQVASYSAADLPVELPAPLQEHYEVCDELLLRTPGARKMGPVTHLELWREMVRSNAILYPTHCSEVSCMVALEAQALGVPIVTTHDFALPETVAFKPALITESWGSPEYLERFVATAERLVEDVDFHRAARQAGLDHVRRESHSWNALAQQWTDGFQDRFQARARTQKAGILRRWLRLGDFAAARRWVAAEAYPETVFDPADLRAMERGPLAVGEVRLKRQLYKIDDVNAPPRYLAVRDAIERQVAAAATRRPEGRLTLVDLSRFTGSLSLPWLSRHPEATLIGFSDHPEAGGLAAARAAELGLEGRARFEMCDSFAALPDGPHPLGDVVLLHDVLEQVDDPVSLLAWAERNARLGVVGTVPFGPCRSRRAGGWRQRHLRERELRRLLGDPRELKLLAIPGGLEQGEHFGWWIFDFPASPDRRTGPEDEGRLTIDNEILARTPPLAKVSATVLVKDSESDLRRCIESLEKVADEILIGDTGSRDLTVAIAESMGFRHYKGPAPLPPEYSGQRVWVHLDFADFAQARNDLAAHATGDYIYWQDADEILVGAERMRDWVVHNVYFNGCLVAQRHATVDNVPEPDHPLRCFRRQTVEGRQLRWFGSIHEGVGDALNGPPDRLFQDPEIYVVHTGYLVEEANRRKLFGRNLPLLVRDRLKNPERQMGLVLGIREYHSLAMREVEQAGRMTAGAHRLLNFGYELWHSQVRHLPGPLRSLGFNYSRPILEMLVLYNAPLRLTGELPLQVEFSFTCRRGGFEASSNAPRNPQYFANLQEFRQELEGFFDPLESNIESVLSDRHVTRLGDLEDPGDAVDLLPPELFGISRRTGRPGSSVGKPASLVVALTVTPSGLAALEATLGSLRRQSRPADRILLVIPERGRDPSERGFPEPLPGWLHEEPIVVLRPPPEHDLGALNPLVHGLRWLWETCPGIHHLVTVAEGFHYAPDLLKTLTDGARRHPNCVVCTEGGNDASETLRQVQGPAVAPEQAVLVARGVGGALYSTDMFDADFIACESLPHEAVQDSDWWISGYLERRRVPRIHVAGPARHQAVQSSSIDDTSMSSTGKLSAAAGDGLLK